MKHLTSYIYKTQKGKEFLAFIINIFGLPKNRRQVEVWEAYTDAYDANADFCDAECLGVWDMAPKEAADMVTKYRQMFRAEGLRGGIAETLPTFRHDKVDVPTLVQPVNPQDN